MGRELIEVKPSEDELNVARFGIMLQLKSRVPEEIVNTFLENGGAEFIENQVEVLAQERAFSRFYTNIINGS